MIHKVDKSVASPKASIEAHATPSVLEDNGSIKSAAVDGEGGQSLPRYLQHGSTCVRGFASSGFISITGINFTGPSAQITARI